MKKLLTMTSWKTGYSDDFDHVAEESPKHEDLGDSFDR